jgi:hypothetical protein
VSLLVALSGSTAHDTRRPLKPRKRTPVGRDDDRSVYEFTAQGKSDFDEDGYRNGFAAKPNAARCCAHSIENGVEPLRAAPAKLSC